MSTSVSRASLLDPAYRQLLYFVVLVPTTLVLVDTYLLNNCTSPQAKVPWAWITYLWFCLQTAGISYWVGKQIDKSRCWWGILVWIVLLIDIQVIAIVGNGRLWTNHILGFAFASAQAGLAVIWSVLGTGSWRLRFPLFIGGFTWAVCLGIAMHHESMMVLLLGQCVATAAFCVGMRRFGFRFAHVSDMILAGMMNERKAAQFSISHLFYWTTGVAVLVGIGRFIPWRVWLAYLDLRDVPYLIGFIIVLTLVSIIAAWMALGRESWQLRIFVGSLILPTVGAVIGYLGVPSSARGLYWIMGFGWGSSLERCFLWATWATLAGLFLAGILLVVRAQGQRLYRMRGFHTRGGYFRASST